MDKLKSDIEIIDWLNSLEWIEEVRVSPVEIVGKIDLKTTSIDKHDFNLINAYMDNRYYILFDSKLICIERFNA
ncbi:hypothetical protein OCV73_00130 [Barnesiella propionica]|uniref:hypothetical protein n=1 Tax=Barnesiella propionica TaxID=2981781 RepID=UPI0011C9B93A|nr:hypothetical protein [Barnesiella propionica]MCU6767369.1 hypothetical protein [Barnesiella propionica]